MTDISAALDAAVDGAPELRVNPGLAAGVATAGGDLLGTAQAAAHVQNQVTRRTAVDTVAPVVGGHKSLFDRTVGRVMADVEQATPFWKPVNDLLGLQPGAPGGVRPGGGVDLGTAGSETLQAANQPLQIVQHEYRYLKDVGERHGLAAAAVAAVPLTVGAFAGSRVGGTQGAVVGAEAAEWGIAHVLFPGSWDATGASGYVDPHTGQPVSPGRDMARILRGSPQPGSHDWLSGALDGAFDIFADPVAKAMSFKAATLSAEGAGGWAGKAIGNISVANIDQAAGRPAVQAALDDIAAKSAGEITRTYPKLGGPAAARLGEASTRDQVVQVFKNLAADQALLTNTLPTETYVQGLMRGLKETVGNALDDTRLGTGPMSTVLRPVVLDPETLQWSSKQIDLGNNMGLQGIYRMIRTALPHEVAADVVDRMAATPTYELGQRQLIFKNAIMQMLLARGIPTDHPWITGLQHEIEDLTGGVDLEHSGQYGRDMAGNDLSKVAAEFGHPSAALWDLQASTKMAFPNFANIAREVRATNAVRDLYGGVDDWMFAHWTQNVFKPLALLSAGFGIRVAAAEMIPSALRLGVPDMVNAFVANSMRRAGYDVTGDELPHITKVVGSLIDRLPESARLPKMIDRATELTVTNGSHMVPGGVSAGSHISAEFNPVEAATKDLYSAAVADNVKYVETGKFGVFSPGEVTEARTQPEIWQTQLHYIAQDPGGQIIAKAYLEAMQRGATQTEAEQFATTVGERWWNEDATADYKAKFRRNTAPSVAGQDPARSMAETRVKALQGMTHTPQVTNEQPIIGSGPGVQLYKGEPAVSGGEPHVGLIRSLADGQTPSLDVLNSIPEAERPLFVPGKLTRPMVNSNLNRLTSWGFRRGIDPIINYLSREPTYLLEYSKQMDTLEPFVDAGTLTRPEATQVAQVRAVAHMTPFIHNTLERSMFSDLARNWMPFFFAQEQSYKRFGRLLAEDPGAFRQYQMILSGMSNIGQPTTDSNGTSFVTLPGTGWFGKNMPALFSKLGIATTYGTPVAFSGNMKSLSSVFPFTEDINPLAKAGPVVTIPLKAIADIFPKTEPGIASVIGTQADQSSLWNAVIPNSTIVRVLDTIPPFDQAHGFISATNQILQSMQYQQDKAMSAWVKAGHQPTDPGAPHIVPPQTDPQQWNTFIDRVRNQTRILFLLKAAIGMVSPMSPSVSVGDLHLKGQLQADVTKLGLSAGYTKFLADNPDATPYTVGLSASKSGADISPTKPFEEFFNANKALYDKYGSAALWMAPQDPGKYDPAIYSEQLRAHLREAKSSQQYLTDLYVAEGNQIYYNEALPAYEAARAKALGMGAQYAQAQQALRDGNSQPMAQFSAQEAMVARGGNRVLSELSKQFQTELQAFGNLHPVWYQSFLDTSGADKVLREQTVNNMRRMVADGEAPGTAQAANIRVLLAGLDSYLNMVNPANYGGTVPTVVREEANLSWQNYLGQVASNEPGLANVIARIFRKYTG